MALLAYACCLIGCGKAGVMGNESTLSDEQELIVAAFELKIDRVEALLARGIDLSAKMKEHHPDTFKEPWNLGRPALSANWTALIAVASSHAVPPPSFTVQNTLESLERASEELNRIPPAVLRERNDHRLQIARLLIDQGADLDADDGRGATPLYLAITKGYEEMALMLIEVGAEVNTATAAYIDGVSGLTPLQMAVDNPTLVAALLDSGANVNAQDALGRTALHRAVRRECVASVRLLIEAGADKYARDKRNRTPHYWLQSPKSESEKKYACSFSSRVNAR